jgi:hypothetical protein
VPGGCGAHAAAASQPRLDCSHSFAELGEWDAWCWRGGMRLNQSCCSDRADRVRHSLLRRVCLQSPQGSSGALRCVRRSDDSAASGVSAELFRVVLVALQPIATLVAVCDAHSASDRPEWAVAI